MVGVREAEWCLGRFRRLEWDGVYDRI